MSVSSSGGGPTKTLIVKLSSNWGKFYDYLREIGEVKLNENAEEVSLITGERVSTRTPNKTGPKRGVSQIQSTDGSASRVRNKPGPKKKIRVTGEFPLGNESTPRSHPINSYTTTKIGPKSNQGAINAGLRALDRSGRPCRKWRRMDFSLKSFTGITWSVRTWGVLKPVHVMAEDSEPVSLAKGDGEKKLTKEEMFVNGGEFTRRMSGEFLNNAGQENSETRASNTSFSRDNTAISPQPDPSCST